MYLIVTKTDLVAGFTEFFDDLGQAARAQVWGTTFPLALTQSGRATEAFGREFDALIERLQQRVPARLEGERDPHRRGAMLAFPRQMTVLRPVIDSLLKRVFSTSEFDRRLLLRGIYLTSGTQEGMPIDRVLGTVARTLGVAASVAPPPGARGKSYFIEFLLRKVIFQESGLAGADRRFQLQRIVLQSAAYVGFGVVAILGLIALSVSYSANAAYVEEVGASAGKLSATRVAPGDLAADRVLNRLDSLREVAAAAGKYEGDVPWRMRVGLYRGGSLGAAARDAYTRELNGVLPGVLGAQFATQLAANESTPDRLYEYLKGYLMLAQSEHRDLDYLRYLGRIEWQRLYPDDDATAQRLSEHFEELLADKNRLRSIPLDRALVDQSRSTLRSASMPALMYSRLKLEYADEAKAPLRLDLCCWHRSAAHLHPPQRLAAFGADAGALHACGVPRGNSTGKFDLVRQFAGDAWVFGGESLDLARSATLLGDVISLYEQDYIRAWDEVLRDVTLKPTSNAKELADVLSIASGASSPFKGLLNIVSTNTDLLREEKSAARQAAKRTLDGRAAQLVRILGGQTSGDERPGARVSAHFAPIRQLMTGSGGSAQIDSVLLALADTQRRLQSIGSGLGDTNALDALSRNGEADALRSLRSWHVSFRFRSAT